MPLYLTFVAISMKTICDTISCVLHRCARALMRSRGLLCARALDALAQAIMRSCTGCARAGYNALVHLMRSCRL